MLDASIAGDFTKGQGNVQQETTRNDTSPLADTGTLCSIPARLRRYGDGAGCAGRRSRPENPMLNLPYLVLLVGLLAGCGGSDSGNGDAAGDVPTETPADNAADADADGDAAPDVGADSAPDTGADADVEPDGDAAPDMHGEGHGEGDGHADGEGHGEADAPLETEAVGDALVETDSGLLAFGATCTDNSECDSDLCFAFGDGSSLCTLPCTDAAECPAGSRGAYCNARGVCRP
jgi:hypothetical protein